MRDADEWAASLNGAEYVDDESGWQVGKIAALIREAQLDGVRHVGETIMLARDDFAKPTPAVNFDDLIGRPLGGCDD